jgi:hypothetical protein
MKRKTTFAAAIVSCASPLAVATPSASAASRARCVPVHVKQPWRRHVHHDQSRATALRHRGGLEDWNAAGFPTETASADDDVTTGEAAPTRLVVLPDGPYQVTGPLEIMRPVGEPIPANDPVYLCRCGRSATKQFCDGSHARTEWKDSA